MSIVFKEGTPLLPLEAKHKLKCVMETSNRTSHGLGTLQEPLGTQLFCYKNYLIKKHKANFLLLALKHAIEFVK
jgi:hypothetical protein